MLMYQNSNKSLFDGQQRSINLVSFFRNTPLNNKRLCHEEEWHTASYVTEAKLRYITGIWHEAKLSAIWKVCHDSEWHNRIIPRKTLDIRNFCVNRISIWIYNLVSAHPYLFSVHAICTDILPFNEGANRYSDIPPVMSPKRSWGT